MLYNNVIGKVIRKELETLSYEETTYNFEVEDNPNYNYYVGNDKILVHNKCKTKLYRAMSDAELGSLTKHKKFKTIDGAMAEKFMATSYDDRLNGEMHFMVMVNFEWWKLLFQRKV